MKIEIVSIIPSYRLHALHKESQTPTPTWSRQVVRADQLKQLLATRTQRAIVLIKAEGDIGAICTLVNDLVHPQDDVLAPYVLVIGVGGDEADALRLHQAGAEEVIDTVWSQTRLATRLDAIAQRFRNIDEVQRIRLRLEDAQEIGNTGSWNFNLVTEEVWWSPQIYRVLNLGPTHQELGFEAFIQHIYHADREMVRTQMSDAIAKTTRCSFEFRIVLDDSTTRRLRCIGRPEIAEDGDVVGFTGAIQDIDARWQAESKLRRQEDMLGYISEYLPAALYQLRQRKDHSFWFDFVSLGSLSNFDSIKKYVGHEITDIPNRIVPEDRQRLYEAGVNISDEPKLWVDEFRVIDDHGEVRWVAGRSMPEMRDDGSTVWRGVLVDITERKLLAEQVLQADRLSTIGTMASGIAHEVNNPLVYLLGNLQYVLETVENDVFDGQVADMISQAGIDVEIEDLRRAIHSAHKGASRIQVIVRDLMGFGRTGSATEQLVDLKQIAHSAVRMLDNQIRHIATLVCDFDDIPKLRSNGGQLRQVLVNLLLNAAQAMTDEQVDKNRIYLRLMERDSSIIIEVQDNARGILERDQARVFEPFFTTKSLHEGTGLGLYVCRNIIEALGGTLEVESTHGVGSLFRVCLKKRPSTGRR